MSHKMQRKELFQKQDVMSIVIRLLRAGKQRLDAADTAMCGTFLVLFACSTRAEQFAAPISLTRALSCCTEVGFARKDARRRRDRRQAPLHLKEST
jgi:hypothetical protein